MAHFYGFGGPPVWRGGPPRWGGPRSYWGPGHFPIPFYIPGPYMGSSETGAPMPYGQPGPPGQPRRGVRHAARARHALAAPSQLTLLAQQFTKLFNSEANLGPYENQGMDGRYGLYSHTAFMGELKNLANLEGLPDEMKKQVAALYEALGPLGEGLKKGQSINDKFEQAVAGVLGPGEEGLKKLQAIFAQGLDLKKKAAEAAPAPSVVAPTAAPPIKKPVDDRVEDAKIKSTAHVLKA